MRVRIYRGEDFTALTALWDVCGISVTYNDPKIDVPRILATPNSQLLVGLDGERVIASVMVGHEGHRGWIYKLAIHPDFQRKGLGRTLVQYAERWLVARNLPKCHAIIRDTNLAVQGFYERLGYQVQPRRVMGKWIGKDKVDMRPAEIEIVTTFLEMNDRPTRPPAPKPVGSFALMRLDRPNVGFYRYLYNSVGEKWFWIDRRRLSDQALADIIQADSTDIFVLYAGGVPAGYAEIDSKAKPTISIAYFGLMPEFIGRGLGQYLMDWSVDFAWSLGARKLIVDTCTLDHPKALRSYQRAGFQAIRQSRSRIVDPRLEGLIPAHVELRLPPFVPAEFAS